MAKPPRRGGGGRAPRLPKAKQEEPTRADDVYEAEEDAAEWEKGAKQRFDVSMRRYGGMGVLFKNPKAHACAEIGLLH